MSYTMKAESSGTPRIKRNLVDKATYKTGLQKAEIPLWTMIVISLVVAVVLIIANGWLVGFKSVPFNLLIGLCAGSLGGVVGFLFAIPHSNAETSPDVVYQPSTNLEQVSDWLTKIIVGVGLVEADGIAARLGTLGRLIGSVVPGQGAVIPQVIIVFFAALGFFSGYIWTRLYYGELQVLADTKIEAILVPRQEPPAADGDPAAEGEPTPEGPSGQLANQPASQAVSPPASQSGSQAAPEVNSSPAATSQPS